MFFKRTYELSFHKIKRNTRGNTSEIISDAGILECLKILQKNFRFDVISVSFSNTPFKKSRITIKCYPTDKMEIVRLFCKGLYNFIDEVECE